MHAALKKVIVALDLPDTQKAFRVVEEVGDQIEVFKVGPLLFTSAGHEVIQFLHRKKKKIFLDLKLHDTPNIVAETVRQYGDLGVSFATVHCAGGARMLDASAKGCRDASVRLIGVTVLTTQRPGETVVYSPGPGGDSTSVQERMVEMALDARLSGVLTSPQELKTLRARVPATFALVAAGIRPPGMEVFRDDQSRVASPQEALAWGADWLILGRPILHAPDPRAVLAGLF